jgi:hypothetical protein
MKYRRQGKENDSKYDKNKRIAGSKEDKDKRMNVQQTRIENDRKYSRQA